MNIIGISGSPRGAQSQTLRLVAATLEGARKAGAETELVDLGSLRFSFCAACDICHATGRCTHTDEATSLIDRVLKAEAIVLGSPNYFRNVTAPMKAFLDRMSRVVHCQLFSGKYGCSCATAGGPGAEAVTEYLNDVMISLGAFVVGQATASLSLGPDAMARALEEAGALGKELVEAAANKKEYAEQKKTHERTAQYFRKMVEMNKNRWPHEHEFWTKMRQGAQ